HGGAGAAARVANGRAAGAGGDDGGGARAGLRAARAAERGGGGATADHRRPLDGLRDVLDVRAHRGRGAARGAPRRGAASPARGARRRRPPGGTLRGGQAAPARPGALVQVTGRPATAGLVRSRAVLVPL